MSASVTHAETYKFVTKWGSSGSGVGQFSDPPNVAVDSSDNIYVLDCENHRIQKFNSTGGYITQWGSSGSGNGQFSNPYCVAVDSSGNVYVSDTYNSRIQKFNSTGGYITQWGSSGSGDGQFHYPYCVAVDSSGNVYVADNYNNRIQKFALFPLANFSSNVTSGYVPLTVQFYNSSESANGLYWDFGDGSNSTERNPMHTFSALGNYTVNLTASNLNGISSKTTEITVSAQPILPVANFSSNVTSGYVPLTIQFNENSEYATSWNWDFGDVSNSSDQNPIHIFTVPGNYTVNLTVSNANGTNSKFENITVLLAPVYPLANFSSNVTSGFAPLSVHFNDGSENAASWHWDFGDGANSTEQNPMHTYSDPGNYTVNLTVSNANGTNSTAVEVIVSLQPILPLANFSSNVTSGSAPLSVQFNDSSENAASWHWDFGDVSNSSDQNPIHTYSDPGNYTVNLTASNLNGTNSKIGIITVSENSEITGANLYISEQAPENKQPGSSMTYALYYENSGNKTTQNVVLEDLLSNNVSFESASDNGIYNDSTRKIIWNIGSVAPSEHGYRILTVRIPQNVSDGTVLPNNASINTSNSETRYDDNEIIVQTTVSTPDLPPNVGVEPTTEDGVTPSVNWREPINFSYHSCDSATEVNISIHIDDGKPDITGNMTEGPSDWNYTTTFYPRTGKATVTYTVYGCNQSPISFSIYIDPEGYIYDINTGNRIAGASVWLQHPDGTGGWADVTTGQNITDPDTNPLVSDDNGMYQWDVLNGTYRVHIEATGYEPKNSTIVMVPPAVTDLNVGLNRIPYANYSLFKSVINPDPTGDCIINRVGDQIPYRIVVKNEGNVGLTNVTVNDTLLPLPAPTGDDNNDSVLNPGETWIYNAIYILTSSDIDKGSINNTATVTCDQLPEKNSSINTSVAQNKELQIYKSVIGIDEAEDHILDKPGDIINYQVAVRNVGDIDLTNVTVYDPMITLTKSNGDNNDPGVLNPGEVWVYAGNYTLTQSDIDTNGDGSGFVTNTATVHCNELLDESSSIQLPIFTAMNTQVEINSGYNNTSTNGSEPQPQTTNEQLAANSSDGASSEGSGGKSIGSAIVVSSSSGSTSDTSATANSTKTEANTNIEQNSGSSPINVEPTPAQTATKTPTTASKKTPGFEIVTGIMVVLSAMYLCRRR
jgi:trimeric autotransporter adhesin